MHKWGRILWGILYIILIWVFKLVINFSKTYFGVGKIWGFRDWFRRDFFSHSHFRWPLTSKKSLLLWKSNIVKWWWIVVENEVDCGTILKTNQINLKTRELELQLKTATRQFKSNIILCEVKKFTPCVCWDWKKLKEIPKRLFGISGIWKFLINYR